MAITGMVGITHTDAQEQQVSKASVQVVTTDKAQAVRDSLVFSDKPRPTVRFWGNLAQCETGNDWQSGGKYAGGLGIYSNGKFPSATMGTWERYGGEEFASSPGKATREEQIVVANRIAVDGYTTVVHRDPKWAEIHGVPVTYVWEQKPVGLGGWGCYKSKHTGKHRMEKPRMFYSSDPMIVPQARFYLYETGKIVEDLQTFLRIKVDGVYGPKTRRAHLNYLRKRGLSTDGVPAVIRQSRAESAGN